MIPRVIHYCWFGENQLPPLAEKCIASWKKYCPDYKIICWNEKNYDITKNTYVREAYEAKKWAFVSDYVRLDVIYNHGGIYFDTDVELLKNIDELLKNETCFLGTEEPGIIATGLGFGAEKNDHNIKLMLEEYENLHFDLGNGSYDTLACPARNTLPFKKLGLEENNDIQIINGAKIYPKEYFCPKDMKTGRLQLTQNSICIHHFDASWVDEENKKDMKMTHFCYKHFGRFGRVAELVGRYVLHPNNLIKKVKGQNHKKL